MNNTDKIDNVDWKQKYLEEHNKYLEFKKGSIPIQNVIDSLKLFSHTIENMRLMIYKSEIDEYVDSLKKLLKKNDRLNWLDKYYDEHLKVQDLESKVEIYEKFTIPNLKKEKIKVLKTVIRKLNDCTSFFMAVDASDVDDVIEYCESIIKKGE